MADNYGVVTQRQVEEVDPNSGDLVDKWEVVGSTKPTGIQFTIRVDLDQRDPATVAPLLAAAAAEIESIEQL
jgi:hypothetical protein